MQSKVKRTGWIAVLIIITGLSACNVMESKNSKNEYFYYPEKNLYFDPARDLYIFSLDSGKSWDSIAGNQQTIPAVLGEKQIIHANGSPVWANNNNDLLQYNGKILNVVNEESLRPVPKDTKSNISQSDRNTKGDGNNKTRKKPLKRFFEKLFGKKKKDA